MAETRRLILASAPCRSGTSPILAQSPANGERPERLGGRLLDALTTRCECASTEPACEALNRPSGFGTG